MSALIEYARHATSSLASYYTGDGAPALRGAPSPGRMRTLHAALAALAGSTRVKAPKLVVVGTQSSGKSSLLNALVGVSLLPTGDSMTTRAAVHVQVLCADEGGAAHVELGVYAAGEWVPSERVVLSDPVAPSETACVRDAIARATARLLGATPGGIVRDDPVHVRVTAPGVSDASFIDLPGLTMTPLASEGQPADMCEQVRSLIASHVDDRTVVLLVCAARRDLEADAAVELCMRLTGGKRCVGCLTKVDLCESDDAVLAYLDGRHAPELALEYGYFAVSCRDGVHRTRPGLRGPRAGVPALAACLNSVVTRMIEESLPQLRDELEALHETSRLEYEEHSIALPDNPAARLAHCHDLLGAFCARVNASVSGRHPEAHVGCEVRNALAKLRTTLRRDAPFRDGGCFDDARIARAIANAEGWGMASTVPPVEIVEFFVRDAPERPVHALLPHCLACVDAVRNAVVAECDALATDSFARYAPLREWVSRALEALFNEFRHAAARDVEHALDVEEAYVFTDDDAFTRAWNRCATGPSALRGVLASYHAIVTDALAHTVPKIVVLHVRRALRTMHTALAKGLDADRLLVESDDAARARAALGETMHRAQTCLRAIR